MTRKSRKTLRDSWTQCVDNGSSICIFDGTVEEVLEDKKKLKVMVKIFGRKTILELNFVQVVKE